MKQRIAVCCLFIAMLGAGLSIGLRDRHAFAQVTSPTPATVMAGPNTPAALAIPCGSGQASSASASFFVQTNLAQNNIWKCQTTDAGATYAWQAPFVVPSEVSGTTVSIGGSLLLLNTTTSGTATVAGATPGQNCIATRSDGALPAPGTIIDCAVTAANTVTVRLTALIAVTPSATVYSVRVFM